MEVAIPKKEQTKNKRKMIEMTCFTATMLVSSNTDEGVDGVSGVWAG